MYDLLALVDGEFDAERHTVSAMGETYPATDVLSALPYRNGRTLLFSRWAPNRLQLQSEVGDSRSMTNDPQGLGFRYGIRLSDVERDFGRQRLAESWSMVLRRPAGSQPIRSCGPYSLRLSPRTIYFHDVLELYLLVLDLLLSGDSDALRGQSLVVLPAMVPPESSRLFMLQTIDWFCSDRGISLYLLTLNPGWYHRLSATTVALSENDMHRERTADFAASGAHKRFPFFMAWDPNWAPDTKGMLVACDLFRRHDMRGVLHIKVPDGYPDGSESSRRFFELAEHYSDTIHTVTVPPGRGPFMRTVHDDVDTFVYVCPFDIGPRTVLECAGLNKKILFHEANDCDLVAHGLFDGVEGFELFTDDTFAAKVEALRHATAHTASYFTRHSWQRTNEVLRHALGDAELEGFYLEEYPRLASDRSS